MTATHSIHSDSADELAAMITTYRRFAAMDPPALRSLASDKAEA